MSLNIWENNRKLVGCFLWNTMVTGWCKDKLLRNVCWEIVLGIFIKY